MAAADAFLLELFRIGFEFDRLIADRSARQPSQAEHEGHVDQVEELAARLRALGRGPGRPVPAPRGSRPPRYLSADGRRAGW